MYQDLYSEEITKKIAKLKKKDPVGYSQVRKKMDSILADPNHSYKFLQKLNPKPLSSSELKKLRHPTIFSSKNQFGKNTSRVFFR